MINMAYRTKTYISADWDHDFNAVNQLHNWNDSNYWSLSFSDAHELTQSRDSSLNCSIKESLKKRMVASKLFVLIVGNQTTSVKSGGCQLCASYNSHSRYCARYHSVDYRSYIMYECEEALKAYQMGLMKIIVLYNSCRINKSKCPELLRDIGIHMQMGKISSDGECYYDYATVKSAFDESERY